MIKIRRFIFLSGNDRLKQYREGRSILSKMCVEDTAIRLQDGTKKIFFNPKDYGKAEDEDIREFLRYVNGEKSDTPFV